MTDLSAGRELDALVAERVMGRVWDESRCRVCGWPLSDEHCRPNDDCSMRPLPQRRADAPAHYSTDIAAAWSVAVKLAEQRMRTMIAPADADGTAVVKVTRWGVEGETTLVPTMIGPAAQTICRAALAAIKAAA